MALQLEKIFLGNAPNDQRRFISELFKHLKDKFDVIHIPCVGQFSLAKCAIEAGFKPEQIITSDISLFSTLLGYLYSDQDVDTIDFTLGDEYQGRYDKCQSNIEKVAYLFWIMKTKQLRPNLIYEGMFFNEFVDNREAYIVKMVEHLSKLKDYYGGINYTVRDLREVLDEDYGERAIVIVNPPAFAKGYEKMFNFEGAIDYDPHIEEFDFKKEYMDLYNASREKKSCYIWYRYKEATDFNVDEVIFAKEYAIDRFDHWLITKPNLVDDFPYRGVIVYKTPKSYKQNHLRIIPRDYEIRPDSKIGFKTVDADTALYFRDLFAHKLGQTKAEHYFLMTIDGYVFATTGMMTGAMFKMQTDRVFENYGFNAPLDNYPRANRLLMLAITCSDFGSVIRRSTSRVNRVYECKGLRTTCLSKYRKVKLNNGILNVEKREKMNNGLYKIMYDCDFREQTFAEVVEQFLKEEKEYADERQSRKEAEKES